MGFRRKKCGTRRSIALGLVVCMIAFSPLSGNVASWDNSVKVYAEENGTENEQQTATRTYINENINAQNYTYEFHSNVINSYLEPLDSGYMRVQKYNTADVLVEYYSDSFDYISTQTIKAELPIFGGFYAGSDSYYLVWGKNNPRELDSNEVIRVVKYNKKWERVSQCSLYGANTTKPFAGGLVRMTECNGYLFVRTVHEMFSNSDRITHQENMTLQFRIEDMVLTDCMDGASGYAIGHVGHCFNTFILADDTNHILTLDQGDGDPRGAVIGRYGKIPDDYCLTGDYRSVVTWEYQGEPGDNTTKASLGGFEYSDTSILVAGTSIAQDENYESDYAQNLYLSVTDRAELEDTLENDGSKETTTTMRWLTNFKEDGKHFHHCATTPRLVKWSNQLFLLIWSETEYDDPTGKLYYEFIDGRGNQIGEIHAEQGAISDCQPIMKDNKTVWYTTNNKNICFYTIDEAGTLTKKTVVYPEQIDVFPKHMKECRLAVTKIGGIKKNEIDSSFVVTFRGEPLVLDEDYWIRGDGWSTVDGVLYQFSKTISGNNGDFYGDKKFVVRPIRQNVKMKTVSTTSSVATIKWEIESGCMGYEIYRSVDGRAKEKVAVVKDSAIGSWKDRNVEKGHYYSYSMRAYTKKGKKILYTNRTDEITVLPGNAKVFAKPKISSLKRKENKIVVKVSPNKKASGYEYQFSYRSDFEKILKKKRSSSNQVTVPVKGWSIYVRVRAYRKVNGKTLCGVWSKERNIM